MSEDSYEQDDFYKETMSKSLEGQIMAVSAIPKEEVIVNLNGPDNLQGNINI